MSGNDGDETSAAEVSHPWERPDPAWSVHDREEVWETAFFEAGYDVVERPTGERADYYWLEPGDAAVVVPFDGDDLVLVRQYRPRLRQHTLGLPGGGVEDGEAPAVAAKRELREETGLVARDLTYVDSYVPTPWTRYARHVYLTREFDDGKPDRDDAEFIEVERVSADEAIDRLRETEGPADGISLTPLLLAREEGHL